jgi:hypothetical protein
LLGKGEEKPAVEQERILDTGFGAGHLRLENYGLDRQHRLSKGIIRSAVRLRAGAIASIKFMRRIIE